VRSPAALIAAAVATLVVLQPQSASAAWAATGAGNAPAAAAFVRRAAAPTATQVGSTVRLDWGAVTLNQGTAATGYTVLRHSGTGVTQVCTTTEPTRTCTDSAPVQGAVQYGVVATYRSWTGQESPLTAFTLDVAPPVTSVSSNPAPNAAGWNRSAVTISLTAADASAVSSITYRIGAGSPVTVSGSSTSFPVSAQGQTTITYSATDTFGNVESNKTYTVRIDTTAPAVPTINNSISSDSGTAGDRVTNVAVQTLSGTGEVGSTVTISRGATTLGSVVVPAGGLWSTSVTLAEGANSVTAVATDQAGNASAVSAARSFTLDTLLPTVTITDPQNGVAYKNNTGTQTTRWANTCAGTPGACGTSADSGSGVTSVTMVLRDTTTNTCWTGSATTYAACGSALTVTGTTTWSRAIVFNVVNNHTLQLTVTVTDLAGNVATGSVNFSASP
jgi:hypothetical protein